MEIIAFMLPFALIIASGFVIAFVWAVRGGQYDDLDTPSYRILLDDEKITTQTKVKGNVYEPKQ